MTKYNIKGRLAAIGMTAMEFAEKLADVPSPYKVSYKDFSTAINWGGRQTDKQRWICETADRLLREIEEGKEEQK